MRTITLKEIEDAVKEVAKDYPFPKYVGGDLWQITSDFFCNSAALEEIDKRILKQLKGE